MTRVTPFRGAVVTRLHIFLRFALGAGREGGEEEEEEEDKEDNQEEEAPNNDKSQAINSEQVARTLGTRSAPSSSPARAPSPTMAGLQDAARMRVIM